METFEIRYFLAAAEHQNLNKAGLELAVSTPAISRAISRLEEELGIQLFERVGRNIVLSAEGKQFQREVSRVINDLDGIKSRLRPAEFSQSISLIGTEFGISAFLPEIVDRLKRSKITFSLQVKVASSRKQVERIVTDGEAQIGMLAHRPSGDFKCVSLGRFFSKTYVSSLHPLHSKAKSGQRIPVDQLLQHEFIGFSEAVFFDHDNKSSDGWRDDKFARKIGLKAQSIEAGIRAAESGYYVCYLPEPIAKNRNLIPLKIDGCPYKCETEVFLIARRKTDHAWMKFLF